jgi:hypothetical protein
MLVVTSGASVVICRMDSASSSDSRIRSFWMLVVTSGASVVICRMDSASSSDSRIRSFYKLCYEDVTIIALQYYIEL